MTHLLAKVFEPKTNGPEMAVLLTSLLNIPVSSTTLVKEIEEHPNYPSLLSISDVLNSYGIENVGIRIDPAQFLNVPAPFLTQLQGQKSNTLFFTVVKEISNDFVLLFDPEKHRWAKLDLTNFLKRCSMIVLLAEAQEGAGEKNYKKIVLQERRKNIVNAASILSIPSIFIIAAMLVLAGHGLNALLAFIFSITTISGLAISSLLILYELDQYNPLLQQICSSGKKVNCGAVLQSKAAKVGGISWAALGFSYFMGMLLMPLFSGITDPTTVFVLSWINALAIFYVPFSIYYQWKVAKQWCTLCLAVQGILIVQFVISFIGQWYWLSNFSDITYQTPLRVIAAFVVPFIFINQFIPALQKAKENKRNYTELQKLKHNRQVFEAVLHKQKHLSNIPKGLGIRLGNSNASYKLIKVCNPYCKPCSKAHSPMEKLLENNPDIEIQILFTASNDKNDAMNLPVKHLLAIEEKYNEVVLKQALDDWYLAENKNYDTFAAKYPMLSELEKQELKIEKMKNWCDDASIISTPTFFVSISDEKDEPSYYQLPEIYNVADLKYFFSI